MPSDFFIDPTLHPTLKCWKVVEGFRRFWMVLDSFAEKHVKTWCWYQIVSGTELSFRCRCVMDGVARLLPLWMVWGSCGWLWMVMERNFLPLNDVHTVKNRPRTVHMLQESTCA